MTHKTTGEIDLAVKRVQSSIDSAVNSLALAQLNNSRSDRAKPERMVETQRLIGDALQAMQDTIQEISTLDAIGVAMESQLRKIVVTVNQIIEA